MMRFLTVPVLTLMTYAPTAPADQQTSAATDGAGSSDVRKRLMTGEFRWKAGRPLLEINANGLPTVPGNPWVAVKDPSIVRYEGRWHLFCSLRREKGGHGRIRIGYLSFVDWKDAPAAQWHLLTLSDDYHGAPQVFYFTPHKKWYLFYQCADASRDIPYGPCFSTTERMHDPDSWSLPAPCYSRKPDHVTGWLDFWVICDQAKAHLFFTSLDGKMWRAETPLGEFPQGWNDPQVVLEGDIFEASHTYALSGVDKYLTVIEAEAGPRRYYKAYVAERLDGHWTPLATTRTKPFASPVNVTFGERRWTGSISHGELIRAGFDQRLQVDPTHLRFVFQGVSDEDRRGKNYGAIPWRLGMLEMAE